MSTMQLDANLDCYETVRDMRRSEGHFRGSQQTELFYQTWWSDRSRGTLVLTHGLAEHSECYQTFVQRLASPDWDVFAHDLRGHGRSEGKRGLVRSFDDYVLDLLAFLKAIAHDDKKPLVLLGHSMGGLIVLRTIMEHALPIKAAVLSSPLLGIAMKVPALKEWGSKWLAKNWPSLTMYNEIHFDQLIRDHEMVKDYEKDPPRHEKISATLYRGMIDSIDYVNRHADQLPDKLKRPLLFQLAGNDRIVSTSASAAFFEKLNVPDKTLHVYPDSYHEIYNDLDYGVVMEDLRRFLSRWLPSN